MTQGVQLGAAIVFVRDLDRSVTFYREVLGLDMADSSPTAALLVNDDGAELVLRAMGDNAQRALGGVGVQYVVWAVASRADLDRREQLLRDRSAYRQTRTDSGLIAVEGCDPDDIPVVIVHRAHGRAPLRTLPLRIYAW
jgi:catechol-2,3-dioxygenase